MKDELDLEGVSRETAFKMFQEIIPKLKGYKGTLITGTIGENSEGIKGLEEMFYNPEAYNMIPYKKNFEGSDGLFKLD